MIVSNERTLRAERVALPVALRSKLRFALVAGVATAVPFAEGWLANGWLAGLLLVLIGGFLILPRRASVLQNLLVSLIAIFVTVSVCDVILRPLIGQRLHYTPTNIFTRRLPELPILGRFDPNVDYTGEGYGDLAAHAGDEKFRQPRQITLRTDGDGFRNEKHDTIDLLVVGDSFAAGWGTTQDKIFSRLLETRYGRRTYNLAFPGSPWEEYVNFMIESPRLTFAPNAVVVWVLYVGNDLFEPYRATWDQASLPWAGSVGAWVQRYRTFRARSPLRQIIKGVLWQMGDDSVDVIVRELPDGRPVLFTSMNNELGAMSRAQVEQHPNYSLLEQTLAAMRKAVAQQGLEMTALIIPTKQEVYRWILEQRAPRLEDAQPSGFVQAVVSACERARLRCLDTKPYLIQESRRLMESSGELLWWRDDTHLGDRGHEALAHFIAEQVLGIERSSTSAGSRDHECRT
ncbi:MAG: alginate O-acetyltransferase AlgX-related protein [Nitrospiraceae bacterium]